MSTFHPVSAGTADGGAPGAADTTPFGELVRGHRLRIGLTQRELADLSTVSMRAIRNLEQGRALRPRPDTVRLIADALRLGQRARTALEAAARRWQPAAAGLTGELPAPPAALHPAVGREAETDVLAQELSSGVERLVTVVGLSGSGKTRLAQAVADRLHAAGLPVLWHGFAAAGDSAAGGPGVFAGRSAPGRPGTPAQSPAAVVRAFAEDLCGSADGGQEHCAGLAGLVGLVGDRPALLVLDGAPPRAPRFDRLSHLLRDCPGLRLLVTGEEPWDLPGERVFLLAPLAVPAPDRTDADAPAVQVFLSHARRVRPEFTPGPADLARIAGICRALDGHPTALASAASWLVVHDLPDLAAAADHDPAALLDDLAGGDGGRRLRQAVQRALLRLPAGHRALLDAVCAGGEEGFGRGGEDGVALADVMALTGRGPADSGRMLRDLLVQGVIRAGHDRGRSRFRVLGLVRALHRPHSTGAAPAGAHHSRTDDLLTAHQPYPARQSHQPHQSLVVAGPRAAVAAADGTSAVRLAAAAG